ncbi:MAG: chromosome segregation protein SMC [Halioglobus sp.]
MRLKTIKLAGFKSFVDPTSVHFPSNMCAIVGPNGCGKSNVIDAVRWVMGESSAKNLRGESMADVIFNGSVNRQPVGQASIELVFDNSEGRLGGEYASYAEISTKRQVSREGQSEYFLNGTRCRRRDITDIFLGTGLGPRSYAIIEQGMISRLIESKPEELRVFIEEAAGISKYKERRKETESRMRRTLENLERLTDLRDELARQLQHLERQAQAAEKYAEFKAEERTLKAQLLALQWRALDAQITAASRAIGELEVSLEAVHSEHQQVETAIEQHRVEHADRTDAFNTVQARYYTLGSEVTRLEQNIAHQQERARQFELDLSQTRANLEEAESHLADDRRKLQSWEEEVILLEPERERLQAVEAASAEALLAAEAAMHDWQQAWDSFNQEAAEPRQQAEVQQSRIQHLEQVLQRLSARTTQLEEERSGLVTGDADVQVQELSDQLTALEQVMAEQEQQVESLVEKIGDTREQNSRLSGELSETRSSVQQMRGRMASLEALEQAAAEDVGKGVGTWLANRQLQGNARLLDELRVEAGWQRAVETVLGDYLQAVCVSDIGALGDAVQAFDGGQLMLVEPAPDASEEADSLAAKVRGSGAAQALLSGVRAVDDLQAALALRPSLATHESVITRDGIWLGAHWLRVARLSGEEGGIINRREELDSLAARCDEAQQREAQLGDRLKDSERQLRELEEQRQVAQRDLQARTREHADISASLSGQRARLEQIAVRGERIVEDIRQAREQFAQEQQSIAEARQILSQSIELMENDSQRREELLTTRDETRGRLDAARQQARHDKDAAHQVAMRFQGLSTQLQSMRESIERSDRQVEQLRERSATLAQAREENDSPLPELRLQLEEQLEQRLHAETALSAARQSVAEVDHALREAERERAQIEQRANTLRSELEQQRIANQTLQVQRSAAERQLAEDEQDVDTLLAALPEDASEPEWQRALEKVAARIARLGPINLAAIDEYTLQSERKTYLDAQNEDLTTALETLESAIRKIDKETRNRFRDTFERVNTGLGELFPRVFGGGSAYLEMTGDDLLDTGISIMARPPGKKNSTIHLLSGGEKALTAIALVFSIFQLNPAPFCILDEVDAPLDDANTGRYARLVKEMSEKVQFIFITHNKISMEMADQLMGVTMHEPGVSRLVSVDVEAAAELAAS